MKVTCPECGAEATLAQRTCSVCERDLGFPNVRYAERPEEQEALAQRYNTAEARARAEGVGDEFHAFVKAAGGADAIFNRWLGQLHSWVVAHDGRFRCFHERVRAGAPFEEDEWNQQRCAAESAVSPYFYSDLSIAALSLDGQGMSYYGDYTVILDEQTIGHRASVFEENPFFFNRKHQVIAGRSPPLGYRATWADRARLAGAKLGKGITAGMTDADRAALLLGANDDEAECDFIEVHIHGPVHIQSIVRVAGPAPADEMDRSIWSYVKKKLEHVGAVVEETA